MARYSITAKTPVHAAIAALEGASNFARAMGVSRQVVSRWRKRGWFPEKRIEKAAEVSGIPVSKLRR